MAYTFTQTELDALHYLLLTTTVDEYGFMTLAEGSPYNLENLKINLAGDLVGLIEGLKNKESLQKCMLLSKKISGGLIAELLFIDSETDNIIEERYVSNELAEALKNILIAEKITAATENKRFNSEDLDYIMPVPANQLLLLQNANEMIRLHLVETLEIDNKHHSFPAIKPVGADEIKALTGKHIESSDTLCESAVQTKLLKSKKDNRHFIQCESSYLELSPDFAIRLIQQLRETELQSTLCQSMLENSDALEDTPIEIKPSTQENKLDQLYFRDFSLATLYNSFILPDGERQYIKMSTQSKSTKQSINAIFEPKTLLRLLSYPDNNFFLMAETTIAYQCKVLGDITIDRVYFNISPDLALTLKQKIDEDKLYVDSVLFNSNFDDKQESPEQPRRITRSPHIDYQLPQDLNCLQTPALADIQIPLDDEQYIDDMLGKSSSERKKESPESPRRSMDNRYMHFQTRSSTVSEMQPLIANNAAEMLKQLLARKLEQMGDKTLFIKCLTSEKSQEFEINVELNAFLGRELPQQSAIKLFNDQIVDFLRQNTTNLSIDVDSNMQNPTSLNISGETAHLVQFVQNIGNALSHGQSQQLIHN